MDTVKLISFLGHCSIHPPLDDFLLEIGIKKRPKKDDWIGSDATGLVLRFVFSGTFDKRSLIPRKGEGRFVLENVTFARKFPFPLPYGLSLTMSKEEVEKILGAALKETQTPSATFFHDNHMIVVSWNSDEPEEGFVPEPSSRFWNFHASWNFFTLKHTV